MEAKKPLLIVLTPVRNEAWVLKAFLKATSLWADHIIIADQMSTDGSRELYKQFPKVMVIDNPQKEMHQAATRRLLFDAAKMIEGDKILFALDADEFLSGNFPKTEGWRTIMNSEPGDVFEFRWMNLTSDATKYSAWQPYYWAVHFNEDLLNGEYPDNFIHEWRLPWPNHVNHEYVIDDISFIHFARVNIKRQQNKRRFYQVSQSAPLINYSGVTFYRSYHSIEDDILFDVTDGVYAYYMANNINLLKLMDLNDEGNHYSSSVMRIISEKGIAFFRKLDIWDDEFLSKNNLRDPRKPMDKIMHKYLRLTYPYCKTFIVKVLDYLLKKCY